ncbi:MAG TPA: YciI family protein [Candidatus Elarobacter sp.]|jgi:hypothetical protein|nr:YciI family protein [Candidatus Elarobacter sp.]
MKILSVTAIDMASAVPPTQEQMQRMGVFMEECKSRGILLDTGGRYPQMQEFTVQRKDGTTTVTDGPFTESKEFVGGYALMEVKDRDEAIEITNRFLDLIGNATCRILEVGASPEF